MKIKVCGMRDAENIADLCQLSIDYIGFIFYSKSPRYVAHLPKVIIPSTIQRVGVFVNATLEEVQVKAKAFQLDYIQLHGDESPDYCKKLSFKGYQLIKAFSIDEAFDFQKLSDYEPFCAYFLLDAKGQSYGGNGVHFDWKLLEKYKAQKPFFLSGGIDLEMIEEIKGLAIPQLYAIDINSKFEIKPALKNIKKIAQIKIS